MCMFNIISTLYSRMDYAFLAIFYSSGSLAVPSRVSLTPQTNKLKPTEDALCLYTNLEQVRRDDGQAGSILCDRTETRVVTEHGTKDVEEELQGVLVQEVNLWGENNIRHIVTIWYLHIMLYRIVLSVNTSKVSTLCFL